jgi:hypothetical protein
VSAKKEKAIRKIKYFFVTYYCCVKEGVFFHDWKDLCGIYNAEAITPNDFFQVSDHELYRTNFIGCVDGSRGVVPADVSLIGGKSSSHS